MESDTRRLFIAIIAAMAIMVAYQYIVYRAYPPREPLTTQPATAPVAAPYAPPPAARAPDEPPPTRPAPATARAPLAFVAGPADRTVVLGGGAEDALRVHLTPYGAGLDTLELTARDKHGRYRYRLEPDVEDPYLLLNAVDDGARLHYSYATHRIWIDEYGDEGWRLDDLPWQLVESTGAAATFRTSLRDEAEGRELLHLTKIYALVAGKPIIDLSVAIENVAGQPLTIRLEQDGPVGIRKENPVWDMRRVLVAQRTGGGIQLGKGYQHKELRTQTLNPETGYVRMLEPEKGPLVWTVLANKFFGAFTHPATDDREEQQPIVSVQGLVADPHAPEGRSSPMADGDLLTRMVTKPLRLQPDTRLALAFEIYAGPKDTEHLRAVKSAYADHTQYYYQLAQSADARCMCTFSWLTELMVWLLEKIHLLVRNYGVGIIILVIIVRTLLHPLTVFQQKSMFRMQESMARIQPKLDAIKEKYANDKVKQNQEMMRLFGEEGVNPASNFVAFLPMFLQMPILVALWTGLNTDVNLRHAPFDGWWIDDLSSPDALITFDPPIHLPILSWFMGPFYALNILPIVMGISMWLQQKYMPKPQLKARQEHAAQHTAEPKKSRSGLSPEEQMRQQQMMAYMMAILFPLMFYKMPSGLNLYWFATNVFGIGESLIIRRQINAERKRREEGGVPAPRKEGPPKKGGGLVSRFFKHIAQQADELQRKADEVSRQTSARKDADKERKGGKVRKKP